MDQGEYVGGNVQVGQLSRLPEKPTPLPLLAALAAIGVLMFIDFRMLDLRHDVADRELLLVGSGLLILVTVSTCFLLAFRRIRTVLAIVVIAVPWVLGPASYYLLHIGRNTVSASSFEQVQLSMPKNDVRQLLGRPERYTVEDAAPQAISSPRVQCWRYSEDGGGTYEICFSHQTGLVFSKAWSLHAR